MCCLLFAGFDRWSRYIHAKIHICSGTFVEAPWGSLELHGAPCSCMEKSLLSNFFKHRVSWPPALYQFYQLMLPLAL